MSFTKLDYCQYLLSSPINYTVTNLADHLDGITHDYRFYDPDGDGQSKLDHNVASNKLNGFYITGLKQKLKAKVDKIKT